MAITIYPQRFKQFGDISDVNFCLAINSTLKNAFVVADQGGYQEYFTICFDSYEGFLTSLRHELPPRTHILVISPYCLFHSLNPIDLQQKKILIFACNSAPTSLEAIEYFLRQGELAEPNLQQGFADQLFFNLEQTDKLIISDDVYQAQAEFQHLDDTYGWHEQCGMLEWGQQQIFPPGEIACFLVPLKAKQISFNERFKLSGQISLKGYPILHSGPPSFLLEDQQRIYEKLATIKEHAVIATVDNGEIYDIRPTHNVVKPAAEILYDMFLVDSRFRVIYEVGFAFNHYVRPYPANSAMNEVAAGVNGSLHFGLGMLPYTQYHLDIACPNLAVLNNKNQLIFGNAQKPTIRRIKASQCPCLG